MYNDLEAWAAENAANGLKISIQIIRTEAGNWFGRVWVEIDGIQNHVLDTGVCMTVESVMQSLNWNAK